MLHAAVPFFVAGIRLGLGRALVGVVVAEMFTALSGLGYMVVFYGNTFRTAELFVPIVVLALLSIAITNLIYRFERWIAPWRGAIALAIQRIQIASWRRSRTDVETRLVSSRARLLAGLDGARRGARSRSSSAIASVNQPPSMHTLYMRVAHEEGIYKKNGLDVPEIISLTSGPLMTQALAAGHIDVGDTDAEGVMNAVAGGFSLAVVAAPSQHLSYVVMVQPDIKTVKDLAGQPFAISRPGAQSQYLLFPLLDQAGVAHNAVSWIPSAARASAAWR